MSIGEILDNVVRRQRYEAEHPGAEIRYHRDHHFWQAIIPEGNGEIVLTVHGSRGLGELMDRLESREEPAVAESVSEKVKPLPFGKN